jgi:hypothetical protein
MSGTTVHRHELKKFGPTYSKEIGWVGCLGKGAFAHRFGGQSWSAIIQEERQHLSPVLLVVLDLGDSRLAPLRSTSLTELPLFSVVHPEAINARQVYEVLTGDRRIQFIEVQECKPALGDLLLSGPPRECPITLREMTAGEIPADDEHYWEACDSFVGGNSFLRVLGPPIWLQWVEEEICGCGRVMHYFAGIGYEDWNSSGTFLEEEPFIGQMRQPRIGVLGHVGSSWKQRLSTSFDRYWRGA